MWFGSFRLASSLLREGASARRLASTAWDACLSRMALRRRPGSAQGAESRSTSSPKTRPNTLRPSFRGPDKRTRIRRRAIHDGPRPHAPAVHRGWLPGFATRLRNDDAEIRTRCDGAVNRGRSLGDRLPRLVSPRSRRAWSADERHAVRDPPPRAPRNPHHRAGSGDRGPERGDHGAVDRDRPAQATAGSASGAGRGLRLPHCERRPGTAASALLRAVQPAIPEEHPSATMRPASRGESRP